MTLQEFIKKYTGQRVNFDGAYGAQCVDLYRVYVRDVWGKPKTPGVVGAYQIFGSLPPGYEKISYKPGLIPKAGDAMIWNEKQTKNGHVAIVMPGATSTYFDAFQQNAPKGDVNGITGSPGNIQRYTYKNLTGWFRPQAAAQPVPTPPQEQPMNYLQRVLVLTSHIERMDIYKPGIDAYVQKVLQKTNNQFQIEVSYFDSGDAQYHTLHGTGLSGPDNTQTQIVYVDPLEIGIQGHKAEVALGKEFDIVCLLYDPSYIIGDQPTNPVENPITLEGFNPIQIPETWVGQNENASQTAMEIFFSHELSHAEFYIANSEAGANQRDKTHDSFNQTPTYSFMDRFADLLIELKPWWIYLTQGTAHQELEKPKMLALKFQGTVYLPIFAKYVAVSDENTFLELGGSWSYVKELTQAEFDSIVKPYLAKQTIIG